MPISVSGGGGALEFDAVIADSQFQKTIKDIERQLKSLTETAKGEGKAIEDFAKKAAGAAAAYFSLSTATNFISDIVRVRGEFQQLEVAFNTMLGSKVKADKLLAEVTEFAATTPFELSEVAGATKQLLAFGIGAGEIKSTLRSLGDVAAGIGQPLGEIAYLYGTIKTAGKAEREDIKQFAQRGIPIYEALAKVLKVNTNEVNDLVSAGKVGFPEIEAAFKKMTESGSQFGGLMAEQAKTLTGQISNLQDAWAQMLNDIGRSNEGVFADAISLTTKLIDNYETVIDVIKILVVTYGSYRAAVIITNVVEGIRGVLIGANTAGLGALTIAEYLHLQALTLTTKAQKLLNATLLANPIALVAASVAVLVSAILILKRETVSVKNAQDLLADAQKGIADRMAETQAKIQPYVLALKNVTLNEKERLDIYNKLKEISPQLVKGLEAQTLSYEALTKNVNLYLNTLRSELRLEANRAAITASIKQEQVIQDEIDFKKEQIEKLNDRIKKAKDAEDRGLLQFNQKTFESERRALEDKLSQQQEQTAKLGTRQVEDETKAADEMSKVRRRSVDDIKKDIKALEDERDAVSEVSDQYADFTKRIQVLNKELEAITGKEANKLGAKRESALDKLKEEIAEAERRARASGFTKEETELEKINKRYDDLKKKADALKASPVLQTRIENARQTEVGNENIRDEVEVYKKNVEAQRQVFLDFEETKKDIGIENARLLFGEQTKGFDSFMDYLQAEGEKFLGLRNTVSGQLKLEFLGGVINKNDADQVKKATEERIKQFTILLNATKDYKAKEAAINKDYDKMEAANDQFKFAADYEKRKKLLKEGRDKELTDLKNAAIRESDIYKKLNQDIIGFSAERIKKEIENFKKSLQSGKFMQKDGTESDLTPEMKAAIEAVIEQYKGLLKQTDPDSKLSRNFAEAASYVSAIEQGMRGVADSVRDTNAGLADTIDTMSDVLSIAESGLSAAADALSGDFGGAISNVFSYYTKIFDFAFAAPKRTAIETAKELQAFQDQLFSGELAVNEMYRQRAREQAQMTEARLTGLREEKKLLQEQKKQVQDQFNLVLAQLEKENAIIGKTSERYGGVFGIGRKTRAVDITESLAGKNFQQLEELFIKGQLEGKAKELFEQLQKLKEEGADIDTILKDNAQAFNEAITGTTSDALTDSILEGLKNGEKGAADFADNFEGFMRDAILQSLKFQALEGPMKEFYAQFAANAESDGILTPEEVRILRERFNAIVNNASDKFDELQQITNVDLAGSGSGGGNSMAGAIKGISQAQADLLAGQFGGLRLTALDHLRVASTQLTSLQAIQNHTSFLEPMYRLWQRIETNGLDVN